MIGNQKSFKDISCSYNSNIHSYNSALAFMSMSGPQHLLGLSYDGHGPLQHKIHGEIFHHLGPVQPLKGTMPSSVNYMCMTITRHVSFAKAWIPSMTLVPWKNYKQCLKSAIHMSMSTCKHIVSCKTHLCWSIGSSWTFAKAPIGSSIIFPLLTTNLLSLSLVTETHWWTCNKFSSSHEEVHSSAWASVILLFGHYTFLSFCQMVSPAGSWTSLMSQEWWILCDMCCCVTTCSL